MQDKLKTTGNETSNEPWNWDLQKKRSQICDEKDDLESHKLRF